MLAQIDNREIGLSFLIFSLSSSLWTGADFQMSGYIHVGMFLKMILSGIVTVSPQSINNLAESY